MVVSVHFFATPLGLCGMAWRPVPEAEGGFAVTGFQLPEADEASTRERLLRHSGGVETPGIPMEMARLVERVQYHLEGGCCDFQDVPVALEGVGPFAREVYRVCRLIPAGSTRTYGELARELEAPGAARAVGRALGSNPVPLIVPCHRVLAAGGRAGGFSAGHGVATKTLILQLEGAHLPSTDGTQGTPSLFA